MVHTYMWPFSDCALGRSIWIPEEPKLHSAPHTCPGSFPWKPVLPQRWRVQEGVEENMLPIVYTVQICILVLHQQSKQSHFPKHAGCPFGTVESHGSIFSQSVQKSLVHWTRWSSCTLPHEQHQKWHHSPKQPSFLVERLFIVGGCRPRGEHRFMLLHV